MQTTKACLFGGAVFAAGLANADIVYQDSGLTAYGYLAPSFAYVFAGFDVDQTVNTIAYAPESLDISARTPS